MIKEEDKYYIPEISDLKVGYECENRLTGKNWLQLKISKKDAFYISSFINDLELDNLRTPYLTKEDIENLGYFITEDVDKSRKYPEIGSLFVHKTIDVFLTFYQESHYIEIHNNEDYADRKTLYFGYCPSINELKTILKLLER